MVKIGKIPLNLVYGRELFFKYRNKMAEADAPPQP